MKKLIVLITLLSLCFGGKLSAQDEVNFEFDNRDRIPSGTPISEMEYNTARLLTTINKTASAHSNGINFNGINIANSAMNSLAMTWSNVHFRIADDDIVQKCVVLKANGNIRGYEVSNIAVEMIPLSGQFQESLSQEITLSFDKQGQISDFVFSMPHHQYTKFMKGAVTLEDIDKRMQILHYVEQFKTAYIQKDISFMEDVFSDDALIIKGRVVKRVKTEFNPKGKSAVEVEYIKQNKRQYLNDLRAVFKKNSWIKVKFEDIEVEHNPIAPNVYGVTVIQRWYSPTYSDEGVVFMLWDFTNEEQPQIYVRTWQAMDDPNPRFKMTDFDY